ncbi:MAG: hypothetical protein AAF226_03695, partial [Verrucomicrobiota bacterium]
MNFLTNTIISKAAIAALSLGCLTWATAEEPQQSDYYTIVPFAAPEGASIETGGIARMSDSKVAICTRRGQVWTIDHAFGSAEEAEWKLFAEYLHEPLGIDYANGSLYTTQRPEVTRLQDEDGDGRADVFET